MKQVLAVIFLLQALAGAAERSLAELQALAGKVGEITRFYDLYARTTGLEGIYSADGLSGLYFSPTLYSPSYGVDAFRLEPHLRKHAPYFSTFVLYPPTLDSSGSVDHLTAFDIMDVAGGDSSNYAIRTRKGRVLIGDTLSAARLLQQGGGLQIHASLHRISRQISPDTDHVLIGYPPGGSVLHDTLPMLGSCIGCDYWFIQYQTAIDSAWVITPYAGEKIEGYDSIALKSNLGIARLHLFGQGNYWRVLDHHEEGAFGVTLGGVSPPVSDTAWYTLDDLIHVSIRLRPLVGTSNAAGNTFEITGLNTNFTDASLDTTYASTSAAIGLDNSVDAPLHCVIAWSGTGIECLKSATGAFTAANQKGIRNGVEFQGRLGQPASHR